MRLLAKYNQLNIAITIVVMVVAGIVYYFTISRILTHQVDKSLVVEEREVQDHVEMNKRLPQIFRTNHQDIVFTKIEHPVERRFTDTVYRDLKDNELEPGRALYTQVSVKGQLYQIMVIQSKLETEDLIRVIFFITLGLILTLLTGMFLLNRAILSRIWQPFYKILHQLKAFNLTENKETKPIRSSIDEFNELDEAVIIMADRVKDDYQTLKAFTENASHELMTPISVINSKLDSFLQTGNFTQDQSKLLDDIYMSVAKLTRLNRSMLLLAKIENRLITDEQTVNLRTLVSDSLQQFEELNSGSQITMEAQLDNKNVKASLLLMEVLVNNLVSNSIRHNKPGGFITVELNQLKLHISNSGASHATPPEQMFERFERSASSEGSGLGLTICKQICDNYGFDLNYIYLNAVHHFIVTFDRPK